MLDTFTVQVDEANNAVNVATLFTKVDYSGNKSIFQAPAHSLLLRDKLEFFRTYPTKSGNFNGVAKCGFKLTDDEIVAGVDQSTSLVAPEIGQVSFSVPVGVTAASSKKLRQRIIAILDNDTIMDKLFNLEV